jgi:drug/metabolite transporter (DMT)-like permease
VAVVGIVLFGGDYGLIYWAEQSLDSGLTAVVFATLPIITVACAHLYVPGERITTRTLAGSLLAFAGVAALFADSIRIDPSKAQPMLAVIGAAVCAAIAGVASKRHGGALHPAALNAPAMFVGAFVLIALSFINGDGFRLPQDPPTWGAVAYLAIAGTVVTFLIYFGLLKTWSVTSLSFISVFTPLVALLLGILFLDEQLTLPTVAGTVLILAGVVLALRR